MRLMISSPSTDDGSKTGFIFATREESAAFRLAVEANLGYPIPRGTALTNPSPSPPIKGMSRSDPASQAGSSTVKRVFSPGKLLGIMTTDK